MKWNSRLLLVLCLVVLMAPTANRRPHHMYEGPALDLSEVATLRDFFCIAGLGRSRIRSIDGQSVPRRNCYFAVLPGKHRITMDYRRYRRTKVELEYEIEFVAGRHYQQEEVEMRMPGNLSVKRFFTEFFNEADTRLFIWYVDGEQVVAGYRPQQIAERGLPNCGIRDCIATEMAEEYVEDEWEKGHIVESGFFKGKKKTRQE